MVRMQQTADSPEDLGGESLRLESEGIFHFLIEDIYEGMLPDGKTPIRNGGMSVRLQVLHGEHKGKKTSFTMYDPNTSHKDGGAKAKEKQSAFCVAANLLTFDQVNGQNITLDEQAARAHQIIAEVRYPRDDDGNKKVNEKGNSYLELHYSNVYHVDDPRVAKVEKDQTMIGLIDSKYRHIDESYFASVAGKNKPAAPKQNSAPPSFDTGGL